MKTYYILYYYPPYKVGLTRVKQTEIVSDSENKARESFRRIFPGAMIKGIEDCPPS